MDDIDDHDDLEYGAAGNSENLDETHEDHDQGGEDFEIDNRYEGDNPGGVHGVYFNVPEDESDNDRLALNDEQDAMSSILRGFSRISMTPGIVGTGYTPAPQQVKPIKREPRIQAALDAIVALQPIERIEFFKICFPSMSDNEANRLTLIIHKKIEKEWLDLRTMHHYMFTLQDALTSDHSPLFLHFVCSIAKISSTSGTATTTTAHRHSKPSR
jgi:hypothetical protein